MSEVPDLDALVPAIASGDAGAFARLLALAESPVRASLRPFATHLDTEAVVQEAFLRVWQVAPRFTPDGRPHGVLRLAVRIAKNLAIDEVRRQRSRGRAVSAGEDEPLEVAIDPAELDPFLRARIVDCYEKLPPKGALCLNARMDAQGGASDASIAADLGMKTNTFLQNVTRARKAVADCLRAVGVELAGGAA